MAEVYEVQPAAPARGDQRYPGLDRSSYFLWTAGMQLVGAAVMFGFALVEKTSVALSFGGATFLAGLVYLNVLRFRNQGASGWWALGLFVPLLNYYVAVRAWAYPAGYNEHRSLDLPGKLIVGVAVGVLLLAIGVAIFVPIFASEFASVTPVH